MMLVPLLARPDHFFKYLSQSESNDLLDVMVRSWTVRRKRRDGSRYRLYTATLYSLLTAVESMFSSFDLMLELSSVSTSDSFPRKKTFAPR